MNTTDLSFSHAEFQSEKAVVAEVYPREEAKIHALFIVDYWYLNGLN